MTSRTGALSGMSTAATAAVGKVWRLPPRRNPVSLTRDIGVPMRDGVVLLADHYAPVTAGPRPTVLMRCPYGRGPQFGLLMARLFAERGYHVLLQSTRGTFGSGGDFLPAVHEAADGQDTVAWLRTQDWFDGRLGTFGPSYLGWTQWALAADPPPELKAMVVHAGPHDMARLAYGRGPFQLYFLLMWSEMVATQEHIGMVRATARLMRAERRLAPALNRLPMESAADDFGGDGAPWFREWAGGMDPDGPRGAPYRADAALRRVNVPTFLASGFHDPFLDQTMEQYQALRERGVEVGLTVGPWTHLAIDQSIVIPESLAWLDAHLAGEPAPARGHPVRVWVAGQGAWRGLTDWPPPGTHPSALHLQPSGGLAPHPPDGSAFAATSFRYDPAHPTPSVGGRIMSLRAGERDNGSLEARADVLTFTTPRLTAPVEVLGAPRVELRLSSDNPHFDVFVRLCDVDTRGHSRNVTDQITRSQPDACAPGAVHTVAMALDDTAHRFLAGHRIRLQISAGAHPRYARNLGTGDPPATGTAMIPATISVHHSPLHASCLTLPVAGAAPSAEESRRH